MSPTPRVIVRLPVLGPGRLPRRPAPPGTLPASPPPAPLLLSPFRLHFPLLPDASDNFSVQKASGESKMPWPRICSSVSSSQRRDLCIKWMGTILARAGSWVCPVALASDPPGGFLIPNRASTSGPCCPASPEGAPIPGGRTIPGTGQLCLLPAGR